MVLIWLLKLLTQQREGKKMVVKLILLLFLEKRNNLFKFSNEKNQRFSPKEKQDFLFFFIRVYICIFIESQFGCFIELIHVFLFYVVILV